MKFTKILLGVILGLAFAFGACSPTHVEESANEPSAFDVEDIRNASLPSPFMEGETITLMDGYYQGEPFVEGGASKPVATLLEPVVFGDLNEDGQDDAAAVIVSDAGGSGSFYDLVVFYDVDGKAEYVTTFQLGDRLDMRAIGIHDGLIYMEYVGQDEDDSSSQPTQLIREVFALTDGQIRKVSAQDLGSVSGTIYDVPVSEILDTTWQWVAYLDNGEINSFAVENPAKYTLTVLEDGTYALLADCNQVKGEYVSEAAGSIQFMEGAATKMACGDNSRDADYLQMLESVRGYVITDGELVLTLMMDAGSMFFQPAMQILTTLEMTGGN